jgi:hypothetical protein
LAADEAFGLQRADLSDKQMLQFMGRENGEDYNSDFVIMLNTWDGAAAYFRAISRKSAQPIEIARLLGWVRLRNEQGREGQQ